MSLRFRRSMKLIPGVRLTFNKDSLGLSFGVPGARYTMNTKGRRTLSTGLAQHQKHFQQVYPELEFHMLKL